MWGGRSELVGGVLVIGSGGYVPRVERKKGDLFIYIHAFSIKKKKERERERDEI